MEKAELDITLMNACESVAQSLYDVYDFSSADGSGPIPVDMWGDADHSVVPIILVKDTEEHTDVTIGNNSSNGPATDGSGNTIGEELLFQSSATIQIVVRWPGEQIEADKITGIIRDHFRPFQNNPNELVTSYAPTQLGDPAEPVADFNVSNTYIMEVAHRSANDVHQHAVTVDIDYNDVLVDDTKTPIAGVHYAYDVGMDGTTEESIGYGEIVVASGENYVISSPYFAPETLIVNGDVVFDN